MQPIRQSTGHTTPSVLPPPLERVPGLRAPRLAEIADIQHGLIEQVAIRGFLLVVERGLLWWPHDSGPAILLHRITRSAFPYRPVGSTIIDTLPFKIVL